MSTKRAHGQFYTVKNPFTLPPFEKWAGKAGLPAECILEPFAGTNNLINMLQKLSLCHDFASYDIAPASKEVKRRNTLAKFPSGFDICVTNPPWLARNSATRRGLPYLGGNYDDLYKHCLELCLNHCKYVAALVPASYLQSRLFHDRLESYILLHNTIFDDTENPVCLSLFGAEATEAVHIYHDEKYIGELHALARNLPEQKQDKGLKFNDPDGDLGFIAFDDTKGPTIKFCTAEEIEDYPIKTSSRFITRISGYGRVTEKLINKLNRQITIFRNKTTDVFLTPFKGLRLDGVYRRRMDFTLARRFINAT